jgi:hypothetical protein
MAEPMEGVVLYYGDVAVEPMEGVVYDWEYVASLCFLSVLGLVRRC